MWDDDDEYFERDAMQESPLVQGIFVALGIVAVGLAIWWSA